MSAFLLDRLVELLSLSLSLSLSVFLPTQLARGTRKLSRDLERFGRASRRKRAIPLEAELAGTDFGMLGETFQG
jgi:hypothetical protein